MATIVTRSGKGSPLTNNEVDANFTNLNNDKLETNAQIRAAVEAASDSNVFTDADHTKLNGVAASANNYSHPTGNGNNHIPSNGSSGQILGYASAGTAQWQAAPSSDLVDDTSPALGGNLASNGHDVLFADNDKSIFGAGSDLKIYHNGSNSYIDDSGTGDIRLRSSTIKLLGYFPGEDMVIATADGSVSLHYDSSKKFETTATGIDVTGAITVNGAALAGGGGFDSDLTIDGKTANYTIVAGDAGKIISHSDNDVTFTFTAAATLGAGWHCWVKNRAGDTDVTTFDFNGSEKLDGLGNGKLFTGESIHVYCDGSNFHSVDRTIMWAGNTDTDYYAQPIAQGGGSIAGGLQSNASGTTSVALGFSTAASHTNSSAIGYGSIAASTRAMALGWSRSAGTDSLSAQIGTSSSSYGATGSGSIAIGFRAKATSGNSIAIGSETVASGFDNSICIGWQSTATSGRSAAVIGGRGNNSSGDYSVVLGGQGNTATGNHSVAMGDTSTASHNNSVSIGDSVQSTATNQINLGGTADTVRISETYTLPTADGNANQVLQTNGSGALSFATVSGGGGASASADLYLANPSSATNPTAAGANAVAIGDGADAGGAGSISIGRDSAASTLEATAIGQQSLASGVSSMAAGYNSVASAAQAISGPASLASGSNSVSFGIGTNSASYGASGTSSIAMGASSKASNSYAVAIGWSQTASGHQSVILGGNSSTSSGYNSFAVGRLITSSNTYSIGMGNECTASQEASIAIGQGALSAVHGKLAHSGKKFNAIGDAQGGTFVLLSDTTDATAEAMTTNNGSAASNNQVVAASDTCITFSGTVVAMQNGAQSYGSWEIKGLLVNDGGTTTVPNSAITVIHNSSSWGLALSADNTNNALKVQVTGEASHNIRWVANIQTAEVTYA